ncbi:MAG: hypothetical protein L0216_21145 [Planctomycetales bacterium]|nr:hypothetical protein [Planctomycetales bacterium]
MPGGANLAWGPGIAPPPSKLFALGSWSALLAARKIADHFRSDRVGAEHLLAAIAGERESTAARLLGQLGGDPVELSTSLRRTLDPRPAELKDLEQEILRIGRQKEEAVYAQVFELAARLRDQAFRLREKLLAMEAEWQRPSAPASVPKAPQDEPTGSHGPTAALPLGSDSQLAIEWAIEEARTLPVPTLGSQCLLIGLLHLTEGPAAEALRAAGVTLEKAREALRGSR